MKQILDQTQSKTKKYLNYENIALCGSIFVSVTIFALVLSAGG